MNQIWNIWMYVWVLIQELHLGPIYVVSGAKMLILKSLKLSGSSDLDSDVSLQTFNSLRRKSTPMEVVFPVHRNINVLKIFSSVEA